MTSACILCLENFFDGLMDDARIYDIALVPAEIVRIAGERTPMHKALNKKKQARLNHRACVSTFNESKGPRIIASDMVTWQSRSGQVIYLVMDDRFLNFK